MANQKISDYTAITGAGLADGDLFEVVDVSDATDAATGTNKKITRAEARAGLLSGSNVLTELYLGPFALAHGDAGLNQTTGKTLFTPQVGDRILNGTGEITEYWDDPNNEVPYVALGSYRGNSEAVATSDVVLTFVPLIGLTASFNHIPVAGTDYLRIEDAAAVTDFITGGGETKGLGFESFTKVLVATPICAAVVQDGTDLLFVGPTTHGAVDLYFRVLTANPAYYLSGGHLV